MASGVISRFPEAVRKAASFLASFCALQERRCVVCHEPFLPEDGGTSLQVLFCPSCRPSLGRREAGYCPHCGEPAALADAPIVPCGDCLQKLPLWNDFLFHGIYEGALRELILRGKFNGGLDALDALGSMLASLCVEHYSVVLPPQVLIPLPLHPSRLRERGLDQCLEIARPLAKALDIPLRLDLLRRVSVAVPQASLDREARKKLCQPFEASPEVTGMRVLLLDDICTTGATLSRATEALLEAGALSVDVVVVARTSLHSTHTNQPNERHGRALP